MSMPLAVLTEEADAMLKVKISSSAFSRLAISCKGCWLSSGGEDSFSLDLIYYSLISMLGSVF